MNIATLKNTIINIKTALPVSVDCVYEKNGLKKTGNPFKDAIKSGTLSGMIGMSYENGVNNQLGREDKEMNFFAKPHTWMTRAENNLGKNARKDDGKRYLPIKVQVASKPRYTLNGVDVTDKVQAFIPKKSAPKTQENLETKVYWRTPELTSIKTIRILGVEHTIE